MHTAHKQPRLAIDLKRLEHLAALADSRHFGRAAGNAHLSQPAFSRSIQSIEGDLGLRLFDRGSNGVVPTPAGSFLIERARQLLSAARNLQRDAVLYRDNQMGDTAFGAGPFPSATIIPAAIAALRRQHPGVALRLETNNWQSLQQRLLDEDIEFFVADIREIPANPKTAVTLLGHLTAGLYVRAGHPLATRACRFAQAWTFGIGTTKVPAPLEPMIGQLIGLAAGEAPVPALQSEDLALLRTLALTTDTVIVAPEAWARADADAGLLTRLKVKDLPPIYSEMGLVQRANRTLSPMARLAIACVREAAVRIGMRPARAGQASG